MLAAFFMGRDHCAWLADDGSVWTCGGNQYGQLGLGLGDRKARNLPVRVPNLPPICSVQTGCYSTLCLDINGEMWSFGFNEWGQLGLGDTASRSYPNMITGIPPVRSFSFHNLFSICLCDEGSIWSFGLNRSGQLGLGHFRNQSAPVQLPSSYFPDEIISVSSGFSHALFLTSEGKVLSCGSNRSGQLGLGDSLTRSIPTIVPHINHFSHISCGGNYSCMVDSSHQLWVCGSQNNVVQATLLHFPRVGLIDNIFVGYNKTFCVNQKCELWGWGKSAMEDHFKLSDNALEAWRGPIIFKENIINLMCIGNSVFIRAESGEAFCCGNNEQGRLGLGHNKNQRSFTNYPEEKFTVRFPVPSRRKFSQKSAQSVMEDLEA